MATDAEADIRVLAMLVGGVKIEFFNEKWYISLDDFMTAFMGATLEEALNKAIKVAAE